MSADLSNPVALAERRQRLLGIGYLVAATVCFAGIDASAKWLSRSMPATQTLVVRYLGSFVIVGLLVNPWTKPGLLRTRRPGLQVARGIGLVFTSACLFTALRHLPLSLVTAIAFAAPLVVALLAGPFLGETLGPRRFIAILVGFSGVLVVTRPWGASFHFGMFLALCCAFSTGIYSIITRMLAAHDPPETTLVYSSLVGAISVAPLVPFVWQTPASLEIWLVMALLGACGALAHWLMILAHKKAPASVVAPFFYTQLLWALGIGAVVFDESPDPFTLIGGGIVMSSGLYLLYRERIRRQHPT